MSSELAIPLDIQFLLDQVDGNATAANVIIEEFAYQAPLDRDQLKQCLAAKDLLMAGKVACYLKNDSGTLGATRLRVIASALEVACQENNETAATKVFQKLCDEITRCTHYILTLPQPLDDYFPCPQTVSDSPVSV
jgi:HPt (histidine-containing phosphotransfer) domain-containing protein